MNRSILILLLLMFAGSTLIGAEDLLDSAWLSTPVKITSGLLQGVESDVVPGIAAFKGIPYAAPPVGNLRWKTPILPTKWQDVRKADHYGDSCLQPEDKIIGSKEQQKMSEDCLYLNVWTKSKTGSEKLPVMFWIHGGGCTTGSGSMPYYDGSRLAQKGVVLVTINYRLGPFGYFGHPALSAESEHKVSGNYGLLDQIFALEWVRDNIAAFGGDPGNVTIFGESAGAISVGCLLVSPLARGLFHRAILESGSILGVTNTLKTLEEQGETLAKSFGTTKPFTASSLRAIPADEVLAKSSPAIGLFGKGIKYRPVIDGYVIPEYPMALFEKGKQAPVPMLIGTNKDEVTIFMGSTFDYLKEAG